ncbi:MAG TPA: class I SAM-dependent methyltransferase [Thermoanaerobaculia bacterium]|nr:class I SAM-dependent methyltransferase [Thermoanaerobaculia bacterium]
MTVWNDADYTKRLAHANWMANTAVLMYLNERATGDPARDWLSSWAHRWFVADRLRVLVLGCGEGWLERAVAQWPFVARIDAVDYAEEAVARARELGRGVAKIHYGVVDLNRDELEADAYDVVVAHSVLHHVQNLEHAYAQIERCMKRDATLIVNEYVGPNRFQYSDDVSSMIDALLRALPEELRQPYESRPRPTVDEMIANDPTEAVRAEELVAMTERVFDVRERKAIGGTILQHLLYDIVQNFRFDVPRERSLLQMLCTIEAMLVDGGRIPCDFVLMAARKKGSRVGRMKRSLPPRAAGAEDVEGDPLRWSDGLSAGRSRRAKSPPLQNHHLRLLRLALLSQQTQRANLFEERAFYSWRERFRARGHDAFEWLLERAPQDPAIRRLLETAATLARA